MVNAQEWLNDKYPKEKRNKILELNIDGKGLDGELDLSDFISLEKLKCEANKLTNLNLTGTSNLKELSCSSNSLENLDLSENKELENLDCSNNQLIDLDASNCSQLKSLHCYDNQLTNLNLGRNLNYLQVLDIRGNNFSKQNLSFLGNYDLKSLENLYLNDNKFEGSLEYLENMSKLKWIDISNTNGSYSNKRV